MTTNDHTVTLNRKGLEWLDWSDQFEALVRAKGLARIVYANEPYLEMPVQPNQLDYPAKKQPNHRSQSSDTTITSGEARMLTAEGLSQYNQDRRDYEFQRTEYTRQQTSLEKLIQHIHSTVAVHLRSSCCRPAEPISVWYQKLQDSVGLSDMELKSKLKERYGEALEHVPKPPRSMEHWIENWETAMATCSGRSYYPATDCGTWFPDLMKALSTRDPSWVSMLKLTHESKVENGELTHHDMGSLMRSQFPAPKKRGHGGAFQTTYGGQEPHSGGDEPPRRSQAAHKRQKRPVKVCDGCEMGHDFENCWIMGLASPPGGDPLRDTSKTREVRERVMADPALRARFERAEAKLKGNRT